MPWKLHRATVAKMGEERQPGIDRAVHMFRDNTAAFVHDLPADAIANVDGESTSVRVVAIDCHGRDPYSLGYPAHGHCLCSLLVQQAATCNGDSCGGRASIHVYSVY